MFLAAVVQKLKFLNNSNVYLIKADEKNNEIPAAIPVLLKIIALEPLDKDGTHTDPLRVSNKSCFKIFTPI
jgi:hypothetical protein